VDRLFVEKKSGMRESISTEPPASRPSYEAAKPVDRGNSMHSSPEPLPFLKSLEKMETQLLSLEWEITKENIEKTKEEVLSLRENLKERPDIVSILNLMGKVLIHMIKNVENIPPPQIKFLLDSKETIKLLMRKETEGEINIYKQLTLGGIEARFLCLEGLEVAKAKKPSLSASEERDKVEVPKIWKDQIEGILKKMSLFSGRMDEILNKIDQLLLKVGQATKILPEELMEERLLPVDVTIFVIYEKLLGIESHKIFKLFKIPDAFLSKYLSQQKILLKDFEVKMVDLKKIFPIENRERRGEKQLLTIKEGSEYKGLIVDQILKKISSQVETSGGYSEYFSGLVHWTYHGEPVEIPILDLKKI
jgi:chemotaxis protein histidine kinase CheA